MTTEFYYHVNAVLTVSLAEVELLTELSAAHYDHHCKEVGRHGGFLYGMKNRATFAEEESRPPPEHTLSNHDIDTLLKILEGLQYADKKHWPLGFALQKKFRDAFRDVSAEWQRLNPRP